VATKEAGFYASHFAQKSYVDFGLELRLRGGGDVTSLPDMKLAVTEKRQNKANLPMVLTIGRL